jgi:glycosyltransferase involved in cell wall biosynthesis
MARAGESPAGSWIDPLIVNDSARLPSKVGVLAVQPGPQPPTNEARRNVWFHLSPQFRGHVVATSWYRSRQEAAGREPSIRAALGEFHYWRLRTHQIPGPLRAPLTFAYFVATGIRLAFSRNSFDVIVCYGPFTTGCAGLAIKYLTGRPLVIEMPGHPLKAFGLSGSRLGRVKTRIARKLVPFVLNRADAIKLLYPTQLDDLEVDPSVPRHVSPDFTPISLIPPSEMDEKYILMLGYPWYLKGVDVLIKAFLELADEFPEHRLMVVGHCDDRRPFEELASGHPRIEFRRAVPHAEAMDLIRKCSVFALPSRTEAMGRVLLEAMAAGKPIVASRVDGIPYVIDNDVTGLLVPPADVSELSRALRRILSDAELRGRLGSTGAEVARQRYAEDRYVRSFEEIVTLALDHRKGASAGKTP